MTVGLASEGVVGVGFRPTDEELIHYLQLKRIDDKRVVEIIPEIDMCELEPQKLPEYFFHHPRAKGKKQLNRATDMGSWKVTGKDHEIHESWIKQEIGLRKTLVFWGKNGTRTNWIIYEYDSKPTSDHNRILVYRIHKRDNTTDTSSSNELERYYQKVSRILFGEEEDTIRGEADKRRLAKLMSEFKSILDDA